MQAVCQFDEDSTYVILHRVKHLLKIVNLFGNLIVLLLLLCNHSHEIGNVTAELLLHEVHFILGVLNQIMQEGGDDGVGT